MATTGAVFPGTVATANEAPWSDNNWTSASNVTADDTSYASITAATYDTNDQSRVLKASNFDFSAIGATDTIDGIIVTTRSWYANGSVSIDLVQLLNTSLAKVGTNKASTPVALTTSQADQSWGGSTDKWGNSLTASWVKNANFGVAYGTLATGTNADSFCDYITVEVFYTPDTSPQNVNPAGLTSAAAFGTVLPVDPNFQTTPDATDDFNRSDGALGSPWTGPSLGDSYTGSVESNQYRHPSGGQASSVHTTVDSADIEVSFEIAALPGGSDYAGIILCADTATGGVQDAYVVRAHAAGDWHLYKRVATTSSLVTSFTGAQAYSTGDWMGVRKVGSAFALFYSTDGTNWTCIGQTTDSSITASGYAGITAGSGITVEPRFDNFEITNLVVASPQTKVITGLTGTHGFGTVTPVVTVPGFPVNGILDAFTRADDAVGANYTDTVGATSAMQVVSNQATSSPGNYKSAVWTTSFAADQEVFVTWVADLSAFDTGPELYLRWDTAANNGYQIGFDNTAAPATITVYSVAGGTPTARGSTMSITLTAGDKIAADITGSLIRVIQYTGGTWNLVGTVTDSTYTGSGKIGFYSDYWGRTFDDFGGGAVSSTVSVTGLGSAAAFGTVTPATGNVNVAVTGLGSAAAFGAVTAVPGNINVSVSGLTSAAAFGTVTTSATTNVAVAGKTSDAAFGTVTALPGNINVSISGKTSDAAFGTVTPQAGNVNVAITGLTSAAAFSTVTVDTDVSVAVTGLSGTHSFGTVTATPGNINVAVTGLSSTPDFGAISTVAGAVSVSVTGLTSAASFGAITTQEGNVDVSVTGLGSAADFGAVSASAGGTNVAVTGLSSTPDFGTVTTAVGGVTVAVSGLGSAASLGSLSTQQGNVNVALTGLTSAASFGTVNASTSGGGQTKLITGLGSAAAFGTITIQIGGVTIAVTGLGSAASFGALASVDQTLHPAGLTATPGFGAISYSTGGVTVPVTGCNSAAAFSSPSPSGGIPTSGYEATGDSRRTMMYNAK